VPYRADESVDPASQTVAPLAFVDIGNDVHDEWAFVDGKTGAALTYSDVVARATAAKAVLVGEQHDQAVHHRLQAALLTSLAAASADDHRPLQVGLEMVSIDHQQPLDAFAQGDLDVDGVRDALDWVETWGHDFEAYRSLFAAAQQTKTPMFALNVPRSWVRAVSKSPVDAVDPELRAKLPPLDLNDPIHKQALVEFFEQHHPPVPSKKGHKNPVEGFYRVQVLWDDGMAHHAHQRLKTLPEGRVLLVAGSGHIAAYRAVPDRLARRMGLPMADGRQVLTIVPVTLDEGEEAAAIAKDAVAAREADIWAIKKPRELLHL